MSADPKYRIDSGEFDILRMYPALTVVLSLIYAVVIATGAIGNILVFWIVLKSREMWTATNILIANLAFADVFVCAFDLPLSLYYQLTDHWIFGQALCHVLLPAFAVVVYASTLTLAAIAGDRYVLIVFPLRNKISTKGALLLVALIAIFSIAVALPIAVFASYRVLIDPEIGLDRRYCFEDWPTKEIRKAYTVITLVMQFFIPLLIIAFLYFQIFQKIRQRLRTSISAACRKSRTNRMLMAVVLVFAVAWTPYQLFSVLTEFDPDFVSGRYFKLYDLSLRVFAMSSSCINPVLYGGMNDNFRNGFMELLSKVAPRSKNLNLRSTAKNQGRGRTMEQSTLAACNVLRLSRQQQQGQQGPQLQQQGPQLQQQVSLPLRQYPSADCVVGHSVEVGKTELWSRGSVTDKQCEITHEFVRLEASEATDEISERQQDVIAVAETADAHVSGFGHNCESFV